MTLSTPRMSDWAAFVAAAVLVSLGPIAVWLRISGWYTMKKSKLVSTSQQGNLFSIQDESPNSETIEQAIAGPRTGEEPSREMQPGQVPAQSPPVTQAIKCPQCGGPAALSLKESGKYYCQGACSYGDNFYFTI